MGLSLTREVIDQHTQRRHRCGMTTTAATNAARTHPDSLLRLALRLDAVVTGLNGVAYVVAAPLLDDLLGLSSALLRVAGAFLIAFAVAVWLIARPARVSPPAVEALVGANVLWAVGSIVVVTTSGSLTTVGAVWLLLQAAVVAAFAAAQAVGLRRRP
jgi:hypothetical protein